MNLADFKKVTYENKWIIIISIFFIVWKFFLIDVQFRNDLNDARFNDTSVYITHIDSINQCGAIIFCKQFIASFEGYGGFEHLTYRIFFGSIAHFLGMTSLEVFLASFYIGILLLIPTLFFFLKHLNQNKNLLAFSLFFLSLYNGGGSYHGFFWVVPSFFALILFLLLFSIIIGNERHWKIQISLLVPLMIYTHFIGLYFIVLLLIFSIIHRVLTKKTDKIMLKKIGFTFLIAALFYIPTAFYLKNSPYGGNPYGIETFSYALINTTIKNISAITKTISIDSASNDAATMLAKGTESDKTIVRALFPGLAQIKTDYFDWIFRYWVGILLFFFILFLLFYYKQYTLLSLYFAALSFTLISSVSTYGIRSLLLTWPLTFLLYGYGAWFSFVFIRDKIKNRALLLLLNGIIALSVCSFIAINVIYSYSWNQGQVISIDKFIKDL